MSFKFWLLCTTALQGPYYGLQKIIADLHPEPEEDDAEL